MCDTRKRKIVTRLLVAVLLVITAVLSVDVARLTNTINGIGDKNHAIICNIYNVDSHGQSLYQCKDVKIQGAQP